jgi:hypothetical protein
MRTVLAKHFLGATGVAVSNTGRVYVAELFGNRISTISHHKRKTVLSVPSPAAIEWHGGHIFATSNATTPPGSIIRFTPGGGTREARPARPRLPLQRWASARR